MSDHLDPWAVNSLIETPGCNAVEGRVVWAPVRSLWSGGMMMVALIFGPATISPGAVALSAGLAVVTLMAGLSVGLHRRLAHMTFSCSSATQGVLAWLGALVGVAGPIGFVREHHLSDWAQHQVACHPWFAHSRSALLHLFWRTHCRLEMKAPPTFNLRRLTADPTLLWLERTWMLQQVPLAALLFVLGGWPFVVWGVCVRIAVSTTGYWIVAHLAHRPILGGGQAGVPGNDVPWAAIPTMGEAWHNNHHAFPGSARIGLYPGQSDWGFRFIQLLEALGLAWNIRTPDTLPPRPVIRAPGFSARVRGPRPGRRARRPA